MNYQDQMKYDPRSGVTSQVTTGYLQDVPTPASPRFTVIAEQFANLPSGLYKAVMRARSIADRYGGTMPEAVGKEAPTGEPSSIASRLEASAATLDQLISQLHAQLDRLERF